jgi:murein DD-endopeptidase MepM/ murein hydrolase activator NlpD
MWNVTNSLRTVGMRVAAHRRIRFRRLVWSPRQGKGFSWLILWASLSSACGDPHVLSGYGSWMGVDGRRRRSAHLGVDYAGRLGAPVLAAANGRVALIEDDPERGCGRGIWIRHDVSPEYMYTRYCHLSEILVTSASVVTRGQLIGRVGVTGDAAGRPHVHFELHRRSMTRAIDPARYDVGCYVSGRSYPDQTLMLTRPISCTGR